MEVYHNECLDYIKKFLKDFLGVKHLPKGFHKKSFYKQAFNTYILLDNVTIDGGEEFKALNSYVEVDD